MKLLPFAALLLLAPAGGDPGYVVHEWGTFTSISGDFGEQLPWRPLAGPSDLPSFVYAPAKGARPFDDLGKGNYSCTVRMETPVLYFYADREREVGVKVDFPQGRITEWYPKAVAARRGIDWGKVKLQPNARPKLLHEGKPSHYYPAREVDAVPLKVGAEQEKFLFYRGVGSFALPLKARLHTDDEVVVRTAGVPVEGVILFENRGGKMGWTTIEKLEEKVLLRRPALDGSLPRLRAELERLLVAQGLYAKEAASMLETWKDSWFEEGLRLIYLVPRAATDLVLPLQLDPKPRECVRVLVGRMELLTPSFRERVEGVVERLDSLSPGERNAAAAELKTLGRFAHPLLWRHSYTVKDKASKAKLSEILYR